MAVKFTLHLQIFLLIYYLACPYALADSAWNQGDIHSVEQFIELLLPVSGRERRTAFLPLPQWGKKKPAYRKFQWKRFESQHFTFYSYPEGEAVLQEVIRLLEEHFDANNDLFGVTSRFTHKVPVIFYQSREDFEQTHTIRGVIPEGLGGVTELFAWKRVIFPFEGSWTKLEHVVRHEGTHIYQIAMQPRLPLWFIEGSAETNSIGWDADAETILRDAYQNELIPPINQLVRIRGTWLMYKVGHFITNYILQRYGRTAFRDLYINSSKMSFRKNVSRSLKIDLDQLNREVRHELDRQFGEVLRQKDFTDRADEIDKGFLLAAYQDHYLSGLVKRGRLRLHLNHFEPRVGLVSQRVVFDRQLGTESLRRFEGGGDMDKEQIIYTAKRQRNDVLRIQKYEYDSRKRTFKLSKPEEYGWQQIDRITDPTLISTDRFAFIGYTGGFTNLYLYNKQTQKLQQLTHENHHLTGLDYSPRRQQLVYAKEVAKNKAKPTYNYDLFLFDLTTSKEIPLFTTFDNEKRPRFSPRGDAILYVTDRNNRFNIAHYDLQTRQQHQWTDAKIGFPAAEWAGSTRLLVVSPKKLTPHIFRGTLPAHKQRIQRMLTKVEDENATWVSTVNTDTQFYPSIEKPDDTTPTVDIVLGPTQIKQRKLLLKKQQPYRVLALTAIDNEIYFVGKETSAQQRPARERDKPIYFSLGTTTAEAISREPSVAALGRQQLPKTLVEFSKRNTIMEHFVAPDGKQAIVRLNRVLSLDRQEHPDKEDFPLFLVNLSTKQMAPIPSNKYLSNIDYRLERVEFLSNQKILFVAIKPQLQRPKIRLAIYNIEERSLNSAFGRIKEHTISTDSRYVAARTHKDKILLYDTLDGKIRQIYGGGELIPPPSMGFTTSAALAYITKSNTNTPLNYKLNFIHVAAKIQQSVAFYLDDRYQVISGVFSEAFSRNLFTFALRCVDRLSPSKAQALFVFDPGTKELVDISADALKFDHLLFHKRTLFYAAAQEEEGRRYYWYRDGKRGRFFDTETADFHKQSETLVLEGESGLLLFRLKPRTIELLHPQTFGFDISGSTLLFSGLEAKNFQLYALDLKTNNRVLLPPLAGDLLQPKIRVQDGVPEIAFSRYFNDTFSVGSLTLPRDRAAKTSEYRLFTRNDGWLFAPGFAEGQLHGKFAKKPTELIKRPTPIKEPSEDSEIPVLLSDKSAGAFRLRRAAAAVAFDGSRFRYLVSAYAENLFSDHNLFVNSIFLSDELIASVGFSNKRHSYDILANYTDVPEVRVGSVVFNRPFLLDEFREIDLYSEFEVQVYRSLKPESPPWITADVASRTFLVGKAGVAYGFDETVWDRHGPFSGKRLFLKAELGIDVESGNIANADTNLDLRIYTDLTQRFSIASRVVAGISRGDLPTVFLLGGNISFRGVGFDELDGNQYWVFSQDVRIPILDFVGARVAGPADAFLGLLLRYFDLRGGPYVDVGAVWLEDEDYDQIYSVGYFFSVPTIFGLNFRFSQGLFGEDGINIWLGASW